MKYATDCSLYPCEVGDSIKKIIISSGYYATNIGNAFYDLGAWYVLNKCLGRDARVIISSDKMNVYWSELFGGADCSYDHTVHYDSDYVVLMGPVFSEEYISLWEKSIDLMTKRGIRIVFMSAGANAYDKNEYDGIERILKRHRLYALLTRDSETYAMYKDFFENSYEGICCALYCNEYAPKHTVNSVPYVVMNFDNCEEPLIVPDDNGSLYINGRNYSLVRCRRGARKPTTLAGGEQIIRTVHSVIPNRKYKKADINLNYFVSDIPYDYLNIYANATAVITNRVHAAVPSLSYGTPVYLSNDTPRGRILNRIGCTEAYNRLYRADKETLDYEKQQYEEAIKRIFI